MYPTQGILTTHYHADHAGAVILLKAPQPTALFGREGLVVVHARSPLQDVVVRWTARLWADAVVGYHIPSCFALDPSG